MDASAVSLTVSVWFVRLLQRVHKTLRVLFGQYLLRAKVVLAWPADTFVDACALSWGPVAAGTVHYTALLADLDAVAGCFLNLHVLWGGREVAQLCSRGLWRQAVCQVGLRGGC